MSVLARGLVVLSDPPLDPTGSEARSWLRRELLDPDYHDRNIVEELVRWLRRTLEGGLGAASGSPPLSTLAGMVVLLLLVAALAWLLSRARRTARGREEARRVLTDEVVSADDLRRRAEAAMGEERYAEAVVEAFRALTARQVERGRLDDAPTATAHEVALVLAADHPALRGRVDASALLFDRVLYGERPATRDEAAAVLALDDALAGAR